MRYNSESLEINVLISRNDALFKNIKISLGLLITAKKNSPFYFEKITTPTCLQQQIIELRGTLSFHQAQNSDKILSINTIIDRNSIY